MEICAGNLIPSQPSIKIVASEVRGKTVFKKVSTSTASFQEIRGEFLIGGKDACKVSNTWLLNLTTVAELVLVFANHMLTRLYRVTRVAHFGYIWAQKSTASERSWWELLVVATSAQATTSLGSTLELVIIHHGSLKPFEEPQRMCKVTCPQLSQVKRKTKPNL